MVDLRRQFENPCQALRTVCSRWSRGVYRSTRRPSEPPIHDSRGQLVRSIGMVQTLLTDAQVAELVAAYIGGASTAHLSERFGIHRRTVVAHLVRQSVPLRRRGLAPRDVLEAVGLYEDGSSLAEIGLRFGADPGTVRRALLAEGVEMRTAWQHMQTSAARSSR